MSQVASAGTCFTNFQAYHKGRELAGCSDGLQRALFSAGFQAEMFPDFCTLKSALREVETVFSPVLLFFCYEVQPPLASASPQSENGGLIYCSVRLQYRATGCTVLKNKIIDINR